MRGKDLFGAVLGTLFILGVLAAGAAWLLDLGDVARDALMGIRWIEALVGAVCLVWLFVLLKAPWDLYFQAGAVAAEMTRSRESGIRVEPAREAYLSRLRGRLLLLALAAHAGSAALAAGIAMWGGGVVGWWFAAFYLVSTVFRPMVSAYRHLMRRLRQMFDEARFPREDVMEMRARVSRHDGEIPALRDRIEALERALATEREEREADARELRGQVQAGAREMEKSLARLTDNQEVVRGIQAFVRLVSHSSRAS